MGSPKLDFRNVYDHKTWVVLYANALGYQEKFLAYCEDYANRTEFPNLDVEIQQFVSGGMFSKERTNMLSCTFHDSTFKSLGIYFRAQQFGNVLIYSLLKCVERGLWDKVTGTNIVAKLAHIRDSCKNMAQWEEFDSLQSLGDLIFVNAMKEFDPSYKENRTLLDRLP